VKLCVVGLGKLGAPLAAVLAAAGHQVSGVDTSDAVVAALAQGRSPVRETGLQEMLDIAGSRLTATNHLAAAVRRSEMTFIIVPTPTRDGGGFSLEHVLPAVAGIGDALRDRGGRHVVVITSTVMPGSTDGPIRSTLETHAGRTVGDDLGLCYSPEFIALGTVIRDMTHPDLVLIGSDMVWAAERLESVVGSYTPDRPPLIRLSLIDAEVAKIAVNTFITTKLSFANQLAEICERLPGADSLAVAQAIGVDTRIGSKYLTPATAYGGPCFPRDNLAFSALARSVGLAADIPEATDRVNRRQSARLADLVMVHLPRDGRVTVLGLTYKPGTPVIDQAPGISLARELTARGVAVTVHDPSGTEAAQGALGDAVSYEGNLGAALTPADVVVITTRWPEYAGVAALAGSRLIIDCWRQCSRTAETSSRIVYPGTFGALSATTALELDGSGAAS
jgi:UDPglucose 6-dehydrogenase